jgi:pyridoxine 5'-phosphate synthase PdxJ
VPDSFEMPPRTRGVRSGTEASTRISLFAHAKRESCNAAQRQVSAAVEQQPEACSDVGNELSEYELQRLQNIRKNEEVLRAMGL